MFAAKSELEQSEPEQSELEQSELEQSEPEQSELEQSEPEQSEPEQLEPEQGVAGCTPLRSCHRGFHTVRNTIPIVVFCTGFAELLGPEQ